MFGSLDRQVVGILFVCSPEHELRNVNLQKGHSDGRGPTASPMVKLAKGWRRARREFTQSELPFHRGESVCFILEFLLDYRKDNLVILVIRYLFPYQGPILPY